MSPLSHSEKMFSSLGLIKDMKNRIKDLRVYVETTVIKARKYMYKWGNTVDGVKVEETLGEGSWVPVLCAIPVFEGLFPAPHDVIVQSLLYRFAQWHPLAKLRLHSESTLNFLKDTFKKLSRQLRKFRNCTCAAFSTVELPKEKAACLQKFAQGVGPHDAPPGSSGPKVKTFNLNTYKFHAMGDYVHTIKFFGTTDSFTTQIGELMHRALKSFYPLTSKHHTSAQLVKHECRRHVLRRVKEAGISSSNQQKNPVSLFGFLQEYDGNPAIKNFILRLKDYILYRLNKMDIGYCDHTFTDEEHDSVIIPNNVIYSVHTMQVHYMTYDMRCEYDMINPRTYADVMVLSGESTPSHPYWYTRVMGIYHLDAWLEGGKKQHLEVLYVRWLAPIKSHQSCMQSSRLPKVAFVEESDYDAFGFLDPARPNGELDDWEEYYIRMSISPVETMDIDEVGSDNEGYEDDDEQQMHVDLEDEEPEGEDDDIEDEEDVGESDDGVNDLGEKKHLRWLRRNPRLSVETEASETVFAPAFTISPRVQNIAVGFQLHPYAKVAFHAFRIFLDTYVTAMDGTGIAQQAPAFGEDDVYIAIENGLLLPSQRDASLPLG
ncbi:hypothetical protein BDR07DRAFT_1492894 [Suillus spraguei]|nr:hypothetical protein BDR07DRAFT_1492894 [Suillus spraguei]